MYSVIHSGNN